MKNNSKHKSGIQLLLERYRRVFRIPENKNHYSETDYKRAERRFIKYAIQQGISEGEEELPRI